MKKALIFYPHNPANPMHGSHLRAIQQLNELKGYELYYASTRHTSDTQWPKDRKQVEKILGVKKVYLYEESLYGVLDMALSLPLKVSKIILSLLGFKQKIPNIVMIYWFASIARECRADLIVINYTYWDYLVSKCDKKSAFALELHDMLPVNQYLTDEILLNFHYERKIVKLREGYRKISYVEKKEELPRKVQEEIIRNVRRLGDYDLVWSISHRETEILRSMKGNLHIDTIYPRFPGKEGEKNNDSYALLPIGPNPFKTYAVLRFIQEVMPFIDSVGDGKIWVSGRYWSNTEIEYPRQMKYIGLVDDFAQVLASARVVIVPAAVGTGQQMKIFEALSSGVPVICYRSAVPEFLQNRDTGVVCVEDPAEFAKYLQLLMHDECFYSMMKNNALSFNSRNQQQLTYQDSLAEMEKRWKPVAGR